MVIRFKRFFSIDSAKAIKAQKLGYLNGINYMAPANSAGVGNLCSHHTLPCLTFCLGLESGHAAMVDKVTGTNAVRESRKAKARYFMRHRADYLAEFAYHCACLIRSARKVDMVPVARPNGSTDIPYERMNFRVTPELAAKLTKIVGRAFVPGVYTIATLFPELQFIDYTKNPNRFDKPLPPNYYLVFSHSDANEAQCLALLARGVNVAVIFDGPFPRTWHGHRVVNGDKHDLRHLDPQHGHVVGLSPKGDKIKTDVSGFVVRRAA